LPLILILKVNLEINVGKTLGKTFDAILCFLLLYLALSTTENLALGHKKSGLKAIR